MNKISHAHVNKNQLERTINFSTLMTMAYLNIILKLNEIIRTKNVQLEDLRKQRTTTKFERPIQIYVKLYKNFATIARMKAVMSRQCLDTMEYGYKIQNGTKF